MSEAHQPRRKDGSCRCIVQRENSALQVKDLWMQVLRREKSCAVYPCGRDCCVGSDDIYVAIVFDEKACQKIVGSYQ